MSQSIPRHRDAFALGGWLFADLLLAIAVVFLAASPAGSAEAAATPKPSVSAGASLRPTVPPTPTPRPTTCVDFAAKTKNIVHVASPGGGRLPADDALLAGLAPFRGTRFALLMTFVHGSTPDAGTRLAAAVNDRLRAQLTTEITDRAIVEDFFNAYGGVGSVTFYIYLLETVCK